MNINIVMREIRAWKRKNPRMTTERALKNYRRGIIGLVRGADRGDPLPKPNLPR